MAPANQGSRNGLIAAVVVFVILFVIAAIFAIYYNAELRKQETALRTEHQTYADISDPRGPQIEALKRARTENPKVYGSDTKLLDVALKQRDQLKKLIAGDDQLETPAVIQRAEEATAAAATQAEKADASLGAGTVSLVATVQGLTSAVSSKDAAADRLTRDLEAARKQVVQAEDAKQKALTDMQQAIAQAQKTSQTDVASAVAGRTSLQNSLTQIENTQKAERQTAVEAVNKKTQQVNELNQRLTQLQKELSATRDKLQTMRINTSEPMLRQVDGEIAQVATDGIVFINRGRGDQITAGLTFEIYDQNSGIPPIASNPDVLPVGKASIEVIKVGQATSECRITRQSPGQTIARGDLIVNLVYDPHTQYNFFVYGNFDLDHNGIATTQDTAIIKRLITQWGGRDVEKINVNTDFVILGIEPELPPFTSAELRDPINRKKLDDAQAALNAYEAVKGEAMSLNIPILNQNRFLYLTGFYEQAAR